MAQDKRSLATACSPTLTQQQQEQELVLAARQGDLSLVKQLVALGVSVNAVDDFGLTPLMLFAAQGLDEGVRLLLDTPICLVNKRTSSMVVALHFAAEKGHYACVKQLLQHGAVVNVSDDWGETPLIKASGGESVDEFKRVAVVSLLLNNGARTEMIDLHGRDALVHAARQGATETVQVLLKHGANPNQGCRALSLHEAAAFGHVGCVEALLDAGARANLRNLHGHQPLELATQMDHVNVVSCLLNRVRPSRDSLDLALVTSVTSNATKCLEILLGYGANVDAVSYNGISALHLAIDMGHRDAMMLLIRFNANVNRRVYSVYSCLDAELRGMSILLSCDFVTPVMLAVVRDRSSFLKPLLRAGASVADVIRLRNAGYLSSIETANEELFRWVCDWCEAVPSMLQLARLAVRTFLTLHDADTLYSLPLPRALLDLVALCDLDS